MNCRLHLPRRSLQQRAILVVVVLAAMMSLACGNPQQRIIGEWKKVNEDTVLRFHDNGRLEVTSSGVHVTGRYIFLTEDRVRFQYDGLVGGLFDIAEAITGGNASEFQISITWNRMTLTDINGKQTEYERL
jgi:hypothetical protein